MIPLMLLDVDGVLSRWAAPPTEGWVQASHDLFHANGSTQRIALTWNPSVTARLREWHETGLVELNWLTTWGPGADTTLAEVFGLPRGLRVHHSWRDRPKLPLKFSMEGEWWKYSHVQDLVQEYPQRPIVWVDDDHEYFSSQTRAFLRQHKNTLKVVCPDQSEALTHEDLDEVEAWLEICARVYG